MAEERKGGKKGCPFLELFFFISCPSPYPALAEREGGGKKKLPYLTEEKKKKKEGIPQIFRPREKMVPAPGGA